MLYLEKKLSPVLLPWVRTLWYCNAPSVPHGRERILPNGCLEILLNLHSDTLTDCGVNGAADVQTGRAIVLGARARYEVVDTADMAELMGIVIRPGGFGRFFRERADLFFEQSISLDNVWREPGLVEDLCEASSPEAKLCRLEQSLVGLLRDDACRSEIVDQAMYLFRRKQLNVAECARSVGVSERWLSQVFREEVGVGPKTWCRIHRFQAATRALHAGVDVAWSELALRCGYYDQSHFANDFRAFSGIDPTTYVALRARWRNHVPLI
jgi:AraC-like DNA-binding protein